MMLINLIRALEQAEDKHISGCSRPLEDPDRYAELRQYRFVSSSDKLVCTGKAPGGSYNYAHIDDVYPRDTPHIPVRNDFGGIDFLPNPNYRR